MAAIAALAAAGAATGLALTLGGGDDARPQAPLPTVVTEPPLTVPAPGGRELPAHPAAADDLPGLGGVAAAAAADVGELRVVSVPGGAQELAAAADALSGPGMWVEPLEDDGAQIGLIVASPIDIVGTMDRWALRALGGHVVLIRGRGDDPARYAASL